MSDGGDWEDLSGDELVLPGVSAASSSGCVAQGADFAPFRQGSADAPNGAAGDEDWMSATKPPPLALPAVKATHNGEANNLKASDGKPLILVDFTVLSNGVSNFAHVCIFLRGFC
jgi:hypothetical protein